MSRNNRGTITAEKSDQQYDGRDLYNSNTAQDLINREYEGIASGLGGVSEAGRRVINDNADDPTKNTSDVRDKETAPAKPPVAGTNTTPKKRWQLLASTKLRGKTSLITVMLVLFGGGGAVTIFSSPALAIVQLRQVLTQDLNDQLKAFDDRHAYLLRTKLKTTTSGSCGAVKIACRFNTMSNRQAERFTSKGIVIERDSRGSILPNRGRVTSITIPNPDGGEPFKATTAAQLTTLLRENTHARSGMMKAENPWFASMTDKTMKLTLARLGTSKTSRITGNTNEERERSVSNTIAVGQDIDTRDLTPEVDRETGEPTGRLIGPDGVAMTQAQIDSVNQSGQVAEQAGKIKPSNIAANIGKGVMITGAIDTACTVYNASRMVGALAKVEKAKQAAQMVMPSLLVPADKIMAGAATDGETEYVGNKINNIGGPSQPEEIVDEARIYEAGTREAAPMKKNDAMYATAFDSPGVKAALHGDVTQLDSRHARFSLAGGFIGTLATMNEFIARATGASSPQQVSERCRYVQNPYVRGAALVAGIFVGMGSLGMFQAASITASLAVGMALPYILSIAADVAAGDMFKNLYGDDFGSGSFVGTAGIMSASAQASGMKPLSAQEAVAYTQANNETLARHAETERLLAKNEPFNVYNQYSFLGSIAATITPTLASSRSSVSTMAASVIGLIPTSFSSVIKPAKAANTIGRFQQCKDPAYEELNIGADIYCNIRYGLSEKELAIDPVENALWMESTGNISKDDDTGEPSDNNQEWNYKKFMQECADRTVGYGENQEENQGDGSNCVSAAKEILNQRFRVFTLDRRVADYMDGIDDTPSGAAADAARGAVSAEGWSYPTTNDGDITSGYKAPERGDDHRGVDITHNGGSLGKPIFAAYDGEVVASGPADGFGNWIVITHDVDGKKLSTVYGHMRAGDLKVKAGDTVKAGQLIARIGSEGWSTGPHLHFEIWNGNRLDCGGDCSIDPTGIIEKAKQNSSSTNRSRNEVNL